MSCRVLPLVALLAACQTTDPPPETDVPALRSAAVTLELDRSNYRPNSQVRMRLTNHTSDTLGYNECTRSLERQEGSRWIAHQEPNRICTMHLALIRPRETQTRSTDIPAGTPSGTYRMVLGLSVQRAGADGSALRAVSGAFRVEP
jgi:hypothetical protein